MTRQEFLERLRSALGNDLNGPIIQENVDYYNNYIRDETGKGRTEEEVTAELGDPWVIAQTIIDSSGVRAGAGYQETCDYGAKGTYDGGGQAERPGIRRMGIWWKRLLMILGIVAVFIVIFAVVGGIVSLLAPLVVPILVIAIIIRIFNSRR